MTISIWRYSHLMLAVLSFIFVIVASVTGIILAFEPISNQLKPFAIDDIKNVSVAETISALQNTYDEVISVEVDANNFVLASVVTKEGKSESFYINPKTGKKVGEQIQKAAIFKFATNLHRSLFLKKTGRFFVGLASFLLFLIAISGVVLIIKRQGSFKRFFSKVVNDNFYQYWHVIFGRFSLIPIVVLTLTGVYLSLEKFDLLPKHNTQRTIDFDTLKSESTQSIPEFAIFKNTFLDEVRRIEFPFSTDVEDYFTLELTNRELVVNQITGEILSQVTYPFSKIASYYSLVLHTGQGSVLWSIVLLLASVAILFFIYSGFKMTFSRIKKSKYIKNTSTIDAAEIIVLVGSEGGSTIPFANAFTRALQKEKQQVFIDQLNNYGAYKSAKHLVIFTATYGEGEAPANASKFLDKLVTIEQKQTLNYSVIGFGSLLYPDFCQFAIDVDTALQKHSKFKAISTLYKVNKQSHETVKAWLADWSATSKINLQVELPKPKVSKKGFKSFKVVKRTPLNNDKTYLLQLQPLKKQRFTSGDLLSFVPEDGIERLYSIARYNDEILLSIKQHEFGIVSKYFSTLNAEDVIKAKIQKNYEFHLPKWTKDAVLISNGTGIAPFLGMIDQATPDQNIHLFWGGRTKESFNLYEDYIAKEKIENLQIAYSQEGLKQYVQDVLKMKKGYLTQLIKDEAVIMICGSVAMQTQVLQVIEACCKTLGLTLSDLEINEQLKMDCY